MSTTLSDIIDEDLLARMVGEGFVSRKTVHGLHIFNYTQRAQYENEWNDATLMARGLIVAEATNVVHARPFRKFFNLSQLDAVPDGSPELHEKLDGSLGIAYVHPDNPVVAHVATRGSFTSEQAEWATAWLHERSDHMDWCIDTINAGVTPLFEIIYPSNRIVVEYGERSELVLIGCVDIATGADASPDGWPGSAAATRSDIGIEHLAEMDESNAEGFVLRWPCGTRAKFKYPDYVRLHKILTGVNARTIWEALAAGQGVSEIIDAVPDEFYDWVHGTIVDLQVEYEHHEDEARDVLARVPDAERREQAQFILANAPNPGVVFSMLDGKAYSQHIWKTIKPEAGDSFWNATTKETT